MKLVILAAAIIISSVFMSCKQNTPKPSLINKYSIDVFPTKFSETCYGRVSQDSEIYPYGDKKYEGYVVILKDNGFEVSRKYVLEKEIEIAAKQLVDEEFAKNNPEIMSKKFIPKYDSLVNKLNNK